MVLKLPKISDSWGELSIIAVDAGKDSFVIFRLPNKEWEKLPKGKVLVEDGKGYHLEDEK